MFTKMTEVLTPGTKGVACLSPVEVSSLQSMMSTFSPGMYCSQGTYMSLRVRGQLMMSDTSMEQNSNYRVVRMSRGSVLIAGLGLGMILLPIAKKPEVTSITVIEKFQDVIDLVWPQLQKALGKNAAKITIICADILEWQPPKGMKWDTIYFDIWPNLCTDNLEEMAKLHRRFGRRNKGWMGSWCRDTLLSRRRREDREERRWRY